MHETSTSLLDRLELSDGKLCLDAGCGGGDMTTELARRVSPGGKVLGIDRDRTKLEIATQEARDQNLNNVEYLAGDINETCSGRAFDVVYARFLLTHLRDPLQMLRSFYDCLRPNGCIAIEDIDFSAYFTYPESPAFKRYHEFYCTLVRRQGGDPDIGPRLPGFLRECGYAEVQVFVVQPMALKGEAKLLNPITLQNIAPAILEEGLADENEINKLVRELYDFAADESTLAGVPRIFQTWARRSAAVKTA
jgi:SAM-dependent methyltransferase